MKQQDGNTAFTADERKRIFAAIIAFLAPFITVTLATRIVVMLLLAVGMAPVEVAALAGCCVKTVRTVLHRMKTEDISALLVIHGGGRKGTLEKAGGKVCSDILEKIDKGNYQTLRQIADMIETHFNLKLSVTAVGRFLKKNGFKKLMSASLPAKANPEAQRTFYENVLQPLMEKAKANANTVLLFMDASHFVLGPNFLGGIWCRTRRFVHTFSGRQRYNVLGAIDFVTKNVLTVTNETYITATQVCEMLTLIAKEYAGKEIHIVLDNARYQKTAVVMDLAKSLGITLEYIPPYSPNLNLIERLWKFVKAELRTKYFDAFDEFKIRIDSIIASTATTNRNKIDALIGEKVQLYDNLTLVAPNTYGRVA